MKKHSAFSLIELSIVVIIIGILIAGITQGTRMVKEARLRSARTLTQASPVSGINDLMLWYETSLETSFDNSEQSDGSTISTWYDNNKQAAVKNNATQSTSGYKPLFKTNILNGGIPVVRFDGTDDLMIFDGSLMAGNDYTVFVVEQRRSASAKYFIGGTGYSVTNSNFSFGYVAEKEVKIDQVTSVLSYIGSDYGTIATYSSPIPRIHTARLQKSVSMSYWLNGGSSTDATTTTYSSALVSYAGAALGRKTNTTPTDVFYNGDLAEIIIFTKALSTEERQAVETYLSKKYAIKIS
jgi:prepilin-type N-terminal cleavage/methylation domain-containing protein